MNRKASHLTWMATNDMDLGSTSMTAIYGFRGSAEMVLSFFEKTTGLRMNTNYILGRAGWRLTCRTGGRTTSR